MVKIFLVDEVVEVHAEDLPRLARYWNERKLVWYPV